MTSKLKLMIKIDVKTKLKLNVQLDAVRMNVVYIFAALGGRIFRLFVGKLCPPLVYTIRRFALSWRICRSVAITSVLLI